MRKLDRVLNHVIAFLGLAVLAAIIVMAVVAARTSLLSRDATAYVESSVPRIVADWNPQELEHRVVPEMLSPRVKESILQLFSRLSKLGRLKSLEKPTGRIGSGAYPGTTINGTWADYSVNAEFERERVKIQLVLKRADGGWQIASFSVKPTSPPAPLAGAERGAKKPEDQR